MSGLADARLLLAAPGCLKYCRLLEHCLPGGHSCPRDQPPAVGIRTPGWLTACVCSWLLFQLFPEQAWCPAMGPCGRQRALHPLLGLRGCGPELLGQDPPSSCPPQVGLLENLEQESRYPGNKSGWFQDDTLHFPSVSRCRRDRHLPSPLQKTCSGLRNTPARGRGQQWRLPVACASGLAGWSPELEACYGGRSWSRGALSPDAGRPEATLKGEFSLCLGAWFKDTSTRNEPQ